MTQRVLMLALLLTVEAGCPHTWGKEGYVQKTLHKNIIKESLSRSSCHLNEEQWLALCGKEFDHSGSCPVACPLPEELEEEEW